MNEKRTKKALDESSEEAKKMLNDQNGLAAFISKLEESMNQYPKLGAVIEDVKTMVSMIKSYSKKEYTQIPLASIISILGALIYLVNPMDLIPDAIPVIGQVDDIAVIGLCLKICKSDIENYKKWVASQTEKN